MEARPRRLSELAAGRGEWSRASPAGRRAGRHGAARASGDRAGSPRQAGFPVPAPPRDLLLPRSPHVLPGGVSRDGDLDPEHRPDTHALPREAQEGPDEERPLLILVYQDRWSALSI